MTNNAEVITPITYKNVPVGDRMNHLPRMVGRNFLSFENLMYTYMDRYSNGAYCGGFWDFVEFSNGARAMMFRDDEKVSVSRASNWYEGEMELKTLSIALNLDLLSRMSFDENAQVSERATENYHLLRDAVFDGEILTPEERGQLIRFLD